MYFLVIIKGIKTQKELSDLSADRAFYASRVNVYSYRSGLNKYL